MLCTLSFPNGSHDKQGLTNEESACFLYCRYGVRRADLFQTVDLYEAKNLLKVIDAIHAVGRAAKAAGYQGAAIGDTEAVDVPTQEAPRVMVVSNVSGYTLASDDGPPEMPPKLKRDGYSLADATEHSEPTDSAGPPPPRPKRVDSIIKSPTLSASETPKVSLRVVCECPLDVSRACLLTTQDLFLLNRWWSFS